MAIMRIPLTIWSAESTDERQLRELITAYSRPTRLGVGSARDITSVAVPSLGVSPKMNAQRLDYEVTQYKRTTTSFVSTLHRWT